MNTKTNQPKETVAHLTISKQLHRRIKIKCASDGVMITEAVEKILAREFPETKTKK